MSATVIDIATGKEIPCNEWTNLRENTSGPLLEVFSPDGRVVLSIEKIINQKNADDEESIAA